MEKLRLGKTGIMASRSGFGAIPIQRLDDKASTELLRAAYAGGINFYDTARVYTTSERKIGLALGAVRDKIYIATKSQANTGAELEQHIKSSLENMGTNYIDLFQFHNPAFIPKPGGDDGLYDTALALKKLGKIRHIGITSHRLALAREMVHSGLFETMQFPMSSLATDDELELVTLCKSADVGFIAMKGLAGGLITSAASTFAYLRNLKTVLPIWGIQYEWQLEEFLQFEANPPELNAEMWKRINADRQELSGEFCRSCGYCQPCPVGINISQAARMRLLLGRADWRGLIDEQNQSMMAQVKKCVGCGHCSEHCPYGLPVRTLLQDNLRFYEEFVQQKSEK